MSGDYDYVVKILLRGSRRVGKQSFLKFLESATKDQSIYFTYREIVSKTIKLDQFKVVVRVWDSTIFLGFRTLFQKVVKQADIIIFIFDLTNEESFEDITNYVYELDDEALGKLV